MGGLALPDGVFLISTEIKFLSLKQYFLSTIFKTTTLFTPSCKDWSSNLDSLVLHRLMAPRCGEGHRPGGVSPTRIGLSCGGDWVEDLDGSGGVPEIS